MNPRLHVPLVCLLCAIVTVLWHASALTVPFLSDDYLVVRYLDRQRGAVAWDRVLGEFWSPWFGVHDMYRPLVSLSYGIELQLWGASPVMSHLLNVLVLAVAAAALAFTAGQFFPRSPRAAALVAGLGMALHPAGVEVTHWMAARTSGLELVFSALAMAMLSLSAAGRLRPWPVWLFTLLALLSREGALVLPALLLGLDFVRRGPRAFRDRILHLPLWLLLGGYLLWRLFVLGMMTSGEPLTASPVLANLGSQVAAALVPPGTPKDLVQASGILVLFTVLWMLRLRGALLVALAVLALLPMSRRGAEVAWSGRLAVAAVPVLALILTVAATGGVRPWLRWFGLTGAAATLLCWSVGSRHWQAHYRSGGATVAGLSEGLRSGSSTAPTGLLRVDGGGVPVQLLQSKAWYLLAQRPFAPVDRQLVGLGCLLERDPVSEDLYFDLSPARALLDAGGRVAQWDRGTFRTWERGEATLPAALAPDPARPGTFVAPAPMPLSGVATIKVELLQESAGPWSLRLRAVDARLSDGLMPVAGVVDGRTVWFDLQRALAPVWLWHLDAKWIGVDLTGGEVTRVAPLARPRPLSLRAPLAGREVTLHELAGRLQENSMQAPLQAVILAPATALSVALLPGKGLELPPRVMGELGYMVSVAGPMTCWWFVQTPKDLAGEPGRSALDHFVLRLP